MARKKKSGMTGMAMPPSSGERMSTDISTAENGFIVNVSGESGGKTPNFFSKRFVATSRPQALRIAAHHISSSAKTKSGKKKSKGGLLKKSAA